MPYITYWSVLETPMYTFKSNSIFLSIALLGGISWLLVKNFQKNGAEERMILLWGTGATFLFGFVLAIYLTIIRPDNSDIEMARKLNSHEFKEVEGTISNFQREVNRGKYGKMTSEKFVVDSILFSYNDGPLDQFGSFTNTNNHFIYNGQIARVTYREGEFGALTILKIEIKK